MAFFDEARKNLNQASQSAMQKTKDLSEIAKLNTASAECEDKIRELYSKIGYETFRAYREGVTAETTPLLEEVAELYRMIDANKRRIDEINSANRCPQCGAKVAKKNAFCGNCGYKFPIVEKPAQPMRRFCPNCGAELTGNGAFCGNCGTKVAE